MWITDIIIFEWDYGTIHSALVCTMEQYLNFQSSNNQFEFLNMIFILIFTSQSMTAYIYLYMWSILYWTLPVFYAQVVSVGFVKAGEGAYNVIPEIATFGGTFRRFSTEGFSYLKQRIKEVQFHNLSLLFLTKQ